MTILILKDDIYSQKLVLFLTTVEKEWKITRA